MHTLIFLAENPRIQKSQLFITQKRCASFMKTVIQILILTIIIFVVITLVAMKIETPFDGNDTYGFPFTFHETVGGKIYPEPESRNSTNLGYLFIDFLISGIIGFGLLKLFNRLKK